MIFAIVVGVLAALAAIPILIRGLRARWGSPELRATLHALAIGLALETLPLIVLLIRGGRRPNKR